MAILLGMSGATMARGTYMEPEVFVREAFGGRMPPSRVIWITDAMRADIVRILDHSFPQGRVRYWKEATRSAWVLEETGKEEPITCGIIVQGGRIDQIRVLVYRESRGDEVRYPRFTGQFRNAGMTPKHDLDRPIDGISGATLSVQALTKLTRLALYLDKNDKEQK
jgi:hypothetical protein